MSLRVRAVRARVLWPMLSTPLGQQQRAFTLAHKASHFLRPNHRHLLLGSHAVAAVGPRSMGLHTTKHSQLPWPTGPVDKSEPVIVTRADPTLPDQTLTLFQKLKGFISFYKGGLKELVSNIKAAPKIRDRLAKGETVTRDEMLIHRRTPADKWRLVPFGFLVIIIPELIPLTIFLFPGVCPSTCVTYGQVAKLAAKRDAARSKLHTQALTRIEALGLAPAAFADTQSLAQLVHRNEGIFDMDKLARADLQLVCQFMGLGKIGLISSQSQLKARLAAHLDYLRTDDRLMVAEQTVDSLGLAELIRACQERAIASTGRSEEQLRAALAAWTGLTQAQNRTLPMLSIVWSRLAQFGKST
ncbi:hypothetical protein GGI20_001841 [Coemansia sp. BCRC 34301]|nr:hypothetical protein GGI20_001841 [Coemansia sp. BCRC 34301]